MPEEKTPFLETEVACPACDARAMQRALKSKLYTPGEKDSDQHIRSYLWLDPDFQGMNPSWYLLWQCPHCFYVDLISDFAEPQRDLMNSSIVKAYQNMGERQKQFIQLISKYIDRHEVTFETAMNMHLAAIYIQELPEGEEYRNMSKLSRLYLRAAWLWREENPQVSMEIQQESVSSIQEALGEMMKAFGVLEKKFESLEEWLHRRVKELNLPKPQEDTHPYHVSVGGFLRNFRALRRETAKLQTSLDRDKRGDLSSRGGDTSYKGFPSYLDFLMALGEKWPKIVTNERDCLAQAVKHFTWVYMNEMDMDQVEKVLSTNALIMDLHVRLGEFDDALRTVVSLYKNAMDGKMELQKRIRERKKEGSLSSKEEMTLESKIGRIDYIIQQAAERRRELKDGRFQSFLQKVQPLLDSAKDRSPEEIEEVLLEAGIPQDIIEDLKEKEMIKMPVEKKKRFSLFSGSREGS